MDIEEAKRKLGLFRIPGGEDKAAGNVRCILARLVAARAVSLGELQAARDIMERRRQASCEAYVFLAAMFTSLHDGNTVFNLENEANINGKLLVDICRRNAQNDDDEVISALEADIAAIWPAAVKAAESLKGDIIDRRGDSLWFFDRQREAADCVSRLIANRLKSSGESLADSELYSVVRYIGRDGKEFALGEEQKNAVRATVEHNLTVITGGPGTGKTTIVCSILRALFAKTDLKPADVALAAPTGRAAQRMGEALRAQCEMAECSDACDMNSCAGIATLQGRTVHSLLGGYGPNWTYNDENPLPHRLMIVDECSMVDLLLMRALLAALRSDCRLVLLGDRNQLPPVEAGAVLGDLTETCRSEKDETAFVELTESHRFAGKLKECAEQFNIGECGAIMSSEAKLPKVDGGEWTDVLAKSDTENGCFWYELPDDRLSTTADALLGEWAVATGLAKDGTLARAAKAAGDDDATFGGECTETVRSLFNELEASRILTVVRKGPFGAQHVNELLVRERLGRNPLEPLVDYGIPVIVTKNTPSLNLFNGDVGVTVKRPGRGIYVIFLRGDRVVCCPVSHLPEHDVAYAITVHKSQGSEFGNVLVLLPEDASHPLLNRQLVYTGITRAKRRAIILGTKAALNAAISRKLKRDTGLALTRPS